MRTARWYGLPGTGWRCEVAGMEKLLSAKEVAGIIGYKDLDKARRVIRECIHTENPLRVSERALQEWINRRTYGPGADTPVAEVLEELRFPRRRT